MSISSLLAISDPDSLCRKIQGCIYDRVVDLGKNGCTLGISGGLDSAVVASLAAKAVGGDKVEGLFMPERDTDPQSYADARLVAQTFGLHLKQVNITPILKTIGIYDLEPSTTLMPRFFQQYYVLRKYREYSTKDESTFLKTLKGGGDQPGLRRHIAYFRTKHRVRMVTTYLYAELSNNLVLGACNKSEKMTGFFVPYGDSACDMEPISGLYKTQVIELAERLGVPQQIIDKAPTPDLFPGLTDQKTIEMGYESLDPILIGLEMSMTDEEIRSETRADIEEIEYVRHLVELSVPMRNPPATCEK
jgi:NAD+ synthase